MAKFINRITVSDLKKSEFRKVMASSLNVVVYLSQVYLFDRFNEDTTMTNGNAVQTLKSLTIVST